MSRLIVCLLITASQQACAVADNIFIQPVSIERLKQNELTDSGYIVNASSFKDSSGEYILLLKEYDSPINKLSNQIFLHEIRATLYKNNSGKWKSQWVVKDGVNCPELDFDVGFFDKKLSITDLDHNGVAEVIIPYHTFCGGSVDPSTIKIILIKNGEKFAIRGNSKILIEGEEPYGGDKKIDVKLNYPTNLAFKKFMLEIWNSVYIQKYD